MKPFILWILLIAYAGFLFYVGLLPSNELPSPGLWDKYEHALAYGLFAGIAFVLLQTLKLLWSPKKKFWVIFGCVLGHGVLLEILQSFTLTREMSFWDGVADAVGAGVVLGISLYARPFGKIFRKF